MVLTITIERESINGIDKFELSDLPLHPLILMIGKRAVGKTTLVNNIIDYYRENVGDNMLIISAGHNQFKQYTEKYPNATILNKYKDEHIDNFISKQSDPDSGPGVIVLDDCFSSFNNEWNSNTMKELAWNAMCFQTTVICTQLFPVDFLPEIIGNFDAVFMFHESSNYSQKKLYDMYGKYIYPSFDNFKYSLLKVTDEFFNTMVVYKEGGKDKVGWYMADI